MARSPRDPTTPGGGHRLRDRSSRTGLLRVLGLLLVLAIVVGGLVVRLGGDGSGSPSLFDRPDTTRSGARAAADSVPLPGLSEWGPRGDSAGTPVDAEPGLAGQGGPSAAFQELPDTLEGERAIGEDSADLAADSVYVPPTPPEGWAPASAPSPLARTPVADSLRVPKPEAVRGVYLGSWSAGSRRRLPSLLALADDTEINSFVIDVKDATGEVSYPTEVPLAVQVEADRHVRIRNIRAVLDSLRAHGVYAIARIVAFKDPVLAQARPEWSVKRQDGSVWEDDHGVHWVDSFNRNVWDYNIELAREAVAVGFGEIQWDYVRFPDVPREYAVSAVYPARDGRTKTEAIREFLGYAAERLDTLGVPMTADVFGITTSARRDVGIGQVWEEMADRVDVLLPMVYPSHYPPGSWDFPNPNAAPYQIVKRALDDGMERSALIPNAAEIRPWIQAFTLGEPEYGPRQIRAQIDAAYDAGLREWILWNPAVRYPAEALADANGIEPWFAGMGEALYQPLPDTAAATPDPATPVADTMAVDTVEADTTEADTATSDTAATDTTFTDTAVTGTAVTDTAVTDTTGAPAVDTTAVDTTAVPAADTAGGARSRRRIEP